MSPALRALPLVAAVMMSLLAVTSCRQEEHQRVANLKDPDNTPTMSTTNVATWISDSGYTRFHITAPVWYMYDEASVPRWTFPKGIFLEQFDNNLKQSGTLRCDSAVYFSQKKLWRLDGNVRMKNVRGDKFLTRQLFWDQQGRKIYSDSFIHIEKIDRVIEGHGFTSNETMTDYEINRPTGIFPVKAFTAGSDGASDSAPPPPSPAPPSPAPRPAPPIKVVSPAAKAVHSQR